MHHPACVRYLRDYVSIPSVNPMGRPDLDPAIAGERRYAEHVREQLRSLGVDAELVGSAERPSLVAEVRAAGARETLMVASHLDTVPVDGMEIDPFDPVIADGRLHGRGSCDTKAGLACLVAALEPVLAAGTLRRNLVIVGEADEESTSQGAEDVARHLADRKPDWALVTEPTSLAAITAHKGVVRARLEAHGVACHSSDPSLGRNAISALARAVIALEALALRLRAQPDPELGPATLSVGLIGGGSATNIVPEHAWLTLDRRLLPGETAEMVRKQLEQTLAEAGAADDVEITWLALTKPPMRTGDDEAPVRASLAALAGSGQTARTTTAAFATDGGIFASHGIPCVVLGAGSIEQAHTAREWVPLDEVEAMTAVYRRLLETASD